MSEKLSLAEVIRVLQDRAGVIDPAEMHAILERLIVSPEELTLHALFSERRYARNLVHKTDRFEI